MAGQTDEKTVAGASEHSRKTFEFINVTGDQQVDEESRNTVRTQAMKHFHEKKKRANSKQVTSAVDIRPASDLTRQEVKRFRLLPRGLQALQTQPKPRRSGKQTPDVDSTSLDSSSQPRRRKYAAGWSSKRQSVAEPYISALSLDHYAGQSRSWILDPAQGDVPLLTARMPGATSKEEVSTESEIQRTANIRNGHISTEKLRDPILDLSTSRLNPMAILPDGAPSRTRLLIHHYFTARIRTSSLMMSVRKSWLAIGIQDNAFYNSVLSHYAGTYSLASRQGDPMEALMFRMKSIEIVNDRLNEQELEVSDGTIGAVASMVTYEANNGSPQAIRTHINGLQRMITLRGGFQDANFSGALQRLIAWADLTAASVLLTDPSILKFEEPCLDLPSYQCASALNGPAMPQLACPNHDIAWGRIDKDVSSIFADLRYLNFILRSKDPKDIELADTTWYSDKTYLVQRSLVYLYLHPQSDDAALDTACCIAATIFVNICFRDLGFHAGAIGLLLSNLRNACEPLLALKEHVRGHESDGRATLEKILWVFAFGGIAAVCRPERTWFVEQLVYVCSALDVASWEDMEAILSRILWNAGWEAPRGSLWKSIMAARKNITLLK